MNDLEIVKEIENILEIKLEKLNEIALFNKGYTLNFDGRISGFGLFDSKIDNTKFHQIILCMKKLVNLEVLSLHKNNISNISTIKELKNITILVLSSNKVNNFSAIEKLTKLKIVKFADNKIKDISPLKELKSLTNIVLTGNQISNIYPLKGLKGLIELKLSYNQIKDISPLKELKLIKELHLYNNQIEDISILKFFNSFLDLELSENLDLSNNRIKNICPLETFEKLTSLDLTNNLINDITPMKKLSKLRSIYLGNNQIKDISALSELKSLKHLYLHNNQINDIAPLKELNNLRTLDLRHNQIINLPPWIVEKNMDMKWFSSKNQGVISFFNNPLKSPPVVIVKQGKDAVKNYFKQIENEKGKIKYLFEAKLLVIGEGGTGKTTFTCKMQNCEAEMPVDSNTTLGIDVGNWSYNIDFPKIPDLGQVKFNVNLWDFGGQEIYQGTHQMFFSDKSFYILVADTHRQNTDFSYWLNTVEQLGGDSSSLIIVLNKKYGRVQKFDESGYRGHFGKLIKETVEVDLKEDKAGIVNLQDLVKIYLKQLPGIGDPLPHSWVTIREYLLKEKGNFISFDRFKEICSYSDITDNGMIHTLCVYYNRIGAFTHYVNDPVLQERIYLNSNWLVKTVYEVLDNEIAKTKLGRLTETDIKQIWGKNELHYEVNKLTQLMHKFGLMYHIPSTTKYVVPAHLPRITPYERWEHAQDGNLLQFIYSFDKYMPQGIMSRLIVALHHHIKNHKLVWHRGVNIEANGAHAEIIESYGGSNRFEIRIAGTNKTELLAIIREHFAEVLQPFNNLNYKQLVPCICNECTDSPKPAFHEYNKLLKFKEKGVGSQCENTGENVNAQVLLRIMEYQVYKDNTTTSENEAVRVIKIFLASSAELEDDRSGFEIAIGRENKKWIKKGVFLELIIWEDFIDAMSQNHLQKEYDDAAKESDIFVMLFFTKVGKFTAEEFQVAFGQFIATDKPLVYTYFKDASLNTGKMNREDSNSLFDFQDKLKELGHYKTVYTNTESLILHFFDQLETLEADKRL